MSTSNAKPESTESAWDHYDRWNAALAEVMYPVQSVPAPAYLDMEEEQIRELGRRLGLPEDEVVPDLNQTVIRTSQLTTAHAFRSHAPRILQWRSAPTLAPPPVLPLLAVFSLAAERMTHGEGMSAANYYGRLAALLETGTLKVGHSYRQIAEPLWGSLNYWLAELDGQRGLPTAYSVGLRYVGLALSQALVRATDRQRLREFFNHFDLTPGAEIAPAELELLLDFWVTSQSPSPAGASLSRLWGRASLRPRIAEIAAMELLDWNGVATDVAGRPTARAGVTLTLEVSTFPRRRVRIVASISTSAMGDSTQARLIGDENSFDVPLEPLDDLHLTFADPSLLNSAELLEGVLVVENPATGERFTRQPHRLMVFRRDQLSGRWIETRQVLLGEEVLCLVMEDYVDEVADLLNQVARPGWQSLNDFAGLPHRWILIRGVEIVSRPVTPMPETSDLRPLVPFTVTQLRFSGGFSLPGRDRNRWHTDSAPEVTASNESGIPFQLRLVALGEPTNLGSDDVLLGEWNDNSSGSVFVDLAALELEDGEFATETVESGTGRVSARREFSLRSSLSSKTAGPAHNLVIAHNLGDPLAVLDADKEAENLALAPSVSGAVSSRIEQWHTRPSSVLPGHPRWQVSGNTETRPTLRLSRPAPGSCFYTGQHHLLLDRVEYDSRGKPVTSTTNSRCKYCGETRIESVSYAKNRRQFERKRSEIKLAPAPQPQSNPRTRTVTDVERWKIALDCLHFVAGGSFKSLDMVARQIHDNAIFVSEFTNALEALGRIEIRRSPSTFEVEEWRTCPPTIVDTGDFRVLTGTWGKSLTQRFEEYCNGNSFRFIEEDLPVGIPKKFLRATHEELREFLVDEGIALILNPGAILAAELPSLSRVVAALPRKRIDGISTLALQFFDPVRAAWMDTSTPNGVGAYRTKGFVHRYYLRTDVDVRNGVLAVGTPGLVKHAASMALSKRALAAYDPRSREFIAPLGANLPGLYERALGIETQRVGFARRGYLIYSDVSPHLAARIAYLLEN